MIIKGKIYHPNAIDYVRLKYHCYKNKHHPCHRKDNGKTSWIACWECNGSPDYYDKFFMVIEKDEII